MDWADYKSGAISTAEKRAAQFLKTGTPEGDFYYAMERALDNDGFYKVAALILNDAPKGDIRQALEDAMFSQRFVEAECERIESMLREEYADAKRYDELGY